MHFLTKGECGFVLPSYQNKTYVSIFKGEMFGLIDILGSAQKHNFLIFEWNINKHLLQRNFSVRSKVDSEVLTLSYQDLYRMSQEFQEVYSNLLEESFHLLRRLLLTKLLAMKHCRKLQKEKKNFAYI